MSMTPLQPSAESGTSELAPDVLNTLAELIRGMRFGSIEIVVHEGRVTQIERREKLRLAKPR